jgi:uncharacterized protein (TIGR02996 family)
MASSLDLAAVLPGEADFLAAVVADLSDETPKLIYADWVEEQGDPRGPFLRQFVDAMCRRPAKRTSWLRSLFRRDRDLPDNPDVSATWREMVGVSLTSRIRALEPREHWTAALKTARPAVAIAYELCPEEPFPVGGTKFGGLPSLPEGDEWPRCPSGPMMFLAQFDLAELYRTVAGRMLPPTGLLSFFMWNNSDEDAFGEVDGRGVPGGLRVILTPGDADLRVLLPPEDLTEVLGRPHVPGRLTLTDVLDVGWHSKSDLRSPAMKNAREQLFGCGHDRPPGPDWVPLLYLRTDHDLGRGWGDGHALGWYIRSADLRELRFNNTTAYDIA